MEYHWTIFVSWTKRDLNLFEIFVPFQLQNTSTGYIWISPLLQMYFSPWCTMTYGFSPQCTMTYPAEKREKVALTRSLLFKLYLSLPILFTAEVGLWKKGEVFRKGALHHVEGREHHVIPWNLSQFSWFRGGINCQEENGWFGLVSEEKGGHVTCCPPEEVKRVEKVAIICIPRKLHRRQPLLDAKWTRCGQFVNFLRRRTENELYQLRDFLARCDAMRCQSKLHMRMHEMHLTTCVFDILQNTN